MTDDGLPLVCRIPESHSPTQALRALADWPGLLALFSAGRDPDVARWSFLTADPVRTWALPHAELGVDPFAELKTLWREWPASPLAEGPPFQGGFAGLLGYELGRAWEKYPLARHDEFRIPDMLVGWYDWVLAWDHRRHEAWLVTQGYPEREPASRRRRAEERRDEVLAALKQEAHLATHPSPPAGSMNFLAERYPVPGHPDLFSNFTRPGYLDAVARVVDYIHAGDIFQANMTQRLLHPTVSEPLALFEQLLRDNPAPFAGLMRHDDWSIISASPERFLKIDGNAVETRPIKGTRRRRRRPEADLFTRDELRESLKDRAENVMIVDLLRNDLSRTCLPGSVSVSQLCRVETYATVQHLVSEIHGRLRPEVTPWDVLATAWPGGSISGAPKIRALEIIAELEPTKRGPYTGSLFYLGPDGRLDSNLLIRTFVERHGWLQLGVGGGIVAASQPAAEYDETLHKAAGMLRALASLKADV